MSELEELIALLASMPKPLAEALDNVWNASTSARVSKDFHNKDGTLNEAAYLRYKTNVIKAAWEACGGG
jgi:hypothetical protein